MSVVEVLGHSIGVVPATVGALVAGAGIVLALKTAASWAMGVAYSLALRHAVYAALGAAGLSIETFVDGGILSVLGGLVDVAVDLLGVDLPTLLLDSVAVLAALL